MSPKALKRRGCPATSHLRSPRRKPRTPLTPAASEEKCPQRVLTGPPAPTRCLARSEGAVSVNDHSHLACATRPAHASWPLQPPHVDCCLLLVLACVGNTPCSLAYPDPAVPKGTHSAVVTDSAQPTRGTLPALPTRGFSFFHKKRNLELGVQGGFGAHRHQDRGEHLWDACGLSSWSQRGCSSPDSHVLSRRTGECANVQPLRVSKEDPWQGSCSFSNHREPHVRLYGQQSCRVGEGAARTGHIGPAPRAAELRVQR